MSVTFTVSFFSSVGDPLKGFLSTWELVNAVKCALICNILCVSMPLINDDCPSPGLWDAATKAKDLAQSYPIGKHHDNGRGRDPRRLGLSKRIIDQKGSSIVQNEEKTVSLVTVHCCSSKSISVAGNLPVHPYKVTYANY